MKIFKLTSVLSFSILLSVLLLSSCKKDEISKQTLIGRWPLVYQRMIVYNANGTVNNDYLTPYTGREYLEFFDTGKGFAYFEDSDQESFDYTYDEANKKITLGIGPGAAVYNITRFTATELELTQRDATTLWEGKMKK